MTLEQVDLVFVSFRVVLVGAFFVVLAWLSFRR